MESITPIDGISILLFLGTRFDTFKIYQEERPFLLIDRRSPIVPAHSYVKTGCSGKMACRCIWFVSYLVFLGTSYGTKDTYRSSIKSFNTIFALINIPSPFKKKSVLPTKTGTHVHSFGNGDVLPSCCNIPSGKQCGWGCVAIECKLQDRWWTQPCGRECLRAWEFTREEVSPR